MVPKRFFGINGVRHFPIIPCLHLLFRSSVEGEFPLLSLRMIQMFLTCRRPTGGATLTKPSDWDNDDLGTYFARTSMTVSARSATRVISTGTGNPSDTNKSNKTNVGAIAGGVVGGLAGLILILLLVLYCLHRRKKSLKTSEEKNGHHSPSVPPVELAANSPPQEMPSPGAAKYMTLRQQPEMNTNHLFDEMS